jgi:hypothetical protein
MTRKHAEPADSVVSSARAAIVGLLVLAAALGAVAAAEIRVGFTEGALHGFLVLRTLDGKALAQGELFQVARAGVVDSRTVFRFDDGSTFEEVAKFTQQGVFTLQSYRLVQRGPSFGEDVEIALDRPTGRYRVATKDHKGGDESVVEGALDLPPDAYNGMLLTVAKNLPAGAGETVHFVAFTPKPRIIQIAIAPTNEQKVLVGNLEKTALHFEFRPKLGIWTTLFAKLLGRFPPNEHAWIVMDEVPAFVRFQGPLYLKGPVWRIELMSPRWPE